MEVIKYISEFFFISLSLGMGAFCTLFDTQKTGSGLIKLFSTLCFASLAVALIIFLKTEDATMVPLRIGLYALAMVTHIFVRQFHGEIKNKKMWLLYFVQNFAQLVILYLFVKGTGGELLPKNAGQYLFLLSSVLYLGIVTFSMVLGHWYLVVPKLSENPLKKAVLITWVILGIKVIVTTFFLIKGNDFFVQDSLLGAGYLFNWVILSMRLLWGYLLIGIMSYFSWRLVKMRSIQSATGIFYVMTILVFIGELTSVYMVYRYGMFI